MGKEAGLKFDYDYNPAGIQREHKRTSGFSARLPVS
jgi:hypothetical protein